MTNQRQDVPVFHHLFYDFVQYGHGDHSAVVCGSRNSPEHGIHLPFQHVIHKGLAIFRRAGEGFRIHNRGLFRSTYISQDVPGISTVVHGPRNLVSQQFGLLIFPGLLQFSVQAFHFLLDVLQLFYGGSLGAFQQFSLFLDDFSDSH